MTTTMNYIKLLLKKNGIILVNEMTCFEIFSTLTFGLSDGWWVFHDDLRISDSPLLSLETWEGLLKENGYQNIEVMPELEQRDQTTRHVIKAQSDGCVIYPKTEKETEHSITSFDEQINGKSFKSKRLKEKVVVKNMQKAISATKVTISESDYLDRNILPSSIYLLELHLYSFFHFSGYPKIHRYHLTLGIFLPHR